MDFDEFEIPDLPVTISNDLERHVSEVFLLFDTTHTKTIEPKEVGTVMRALGCCPSLEEIKEFTKQCEDDNIPNLIHLARFLPVMCSKLTAHCYCPSSADDLMNAFRILDPANSGRIPKKEIYEFMTKYGEPFSKDEIEEMMEASFDPRTQTVPYERYLNKIAFVPKVDLYALADEIEASKPQPEKSRHLVSMTIDDFL
ncbi:hypothetical protein FQR65_LT07899 [Abscondita terminalis]|nr:hypothetical protein FQR65_LT07899 [Abscondita terminalis]